MKTEILLQEGTENNIKTKTVTWRKDKSKNTTRFSEGEIPEHANVNNENIMVESLAASPKMPTVVSTNKTRPKNILSSIKKQFNLNGNDGKFLLVNNL